MGRKDEAKQSDDWEDGSPEGRPPVDQLHFYSDLQLFEMVELLRLFGDYYCMEIIRIVSLYISYLNLLSPTSFISHITQPGGLYHSLGKSNKSGAHALSRERSTAGYYGLIPIAHRPGMKRKKRGKLLKIWGPPPEHRVQALG